MRVDFYQLTRDPAEAVLPLIARNTLKAGERLLIVSDDMAQLDRIGNALWERLPDSFLAHGRAEDPHAQRQPILLSRDNQAANQARYLAIADGQWRDSDPGFDRTFYLFGDDTITQARAQWRALNGSDGIDLHFWKQQDGKWKEGP